MGAQKLDPWTLEMLMARAMGDWERMDLAIAMGARVEVFATRDFLDHLRMLQERFLAESHAEAGFLLDQFTRAPKK